MAHLDFEQSVEEAVIAGFVKEEMMVGEESIKMYHEATKRVLRLMKRTDNPKLQPLIDEITEPRREGGHWEFHVAHPAAAFHEYGALTTSLSSLQTSDYAFSWSSDNIRQVRSTLPDHYSRADGPIRIPALRFMHKARMLTIGQMWREFKSH